MTGGPAGDAIVLSADARSHGPREVEELLRALTGAVGARTAPTYASTHVVQTVDGLRHVGALRWEDPPWRLDLLSLARALPSAGVSLCRMTRHGVRLGGPDAPSGATGATVAAAQEAAVARRGRVLTFPGQELATGLVPVAVLTTLTAVDEVVGLAGTPVDERDLVDTGGWLRPRWNRGRLELLVEQGAGGVLRPFEQREQIACCAVH